ncbi:MAG: YihY/virulence factor BrkB family protein [Chitinophagaceae bacterium]|nr:YihY/virulence factor BrkB family protein [Oligoflexus sp.]
MTTMTEVPREMVEGKSYPEAESPLGLQKKDWIEIFKRVKSEIDDDDIGMVAAASAYYALFAIFPLLIATVSIYGFLSDPAELESQIDSISKFIPIEAAKVISDQLHAIISNPNSALGLSALVSILVAIWTSSSGTKSLMKALNIAYDETEKRGFVKLNLQALALTAGAVLAIITAVGLIVGLPIVMNFVGLGSFANDLILVLRWPLLAVLFTIGLEVVNRFGPSRTKPKWRWVSVGAILGTVMILLASAGLAFYVKKFGSYNATYGSLSGVVILLLWFYLVSYAVLLSAETNAEIEHQTLADSTVGPDKPMGQRGALKADTVPSMNPAPVSPSDAKN